MQRADLCVACDRELVRWVRSDKRHCGGVCRMLAHRMRKAGRAAEPTRLRGARQPRSARHQNTGRVRVAAVMQARAEESERVCADLQRRHAEQTGELDRAREELSALQRSVTEQATQPRPEPSVPLLGRDISAKIRALLQPYMPQQTSSRPPSGADGGIAPQTSKQEPGATDTPRARSSPVGNQPVSVQISNQRQSRAGRRAERTPAEPNRELDELRTRLRDYQGAYGRSLEIANQLQRSLTAEQRRTAEQTERAERAERTAADQSRQLRDRQTLLDNSERAQGELFADATRFRESLEAEQLRNTKLSATAEQLITERNLQLRDMQDLLVDQERAHQDVSAVATALQNSLTAEQVRREQAEQRLAIAIDEAERGPLASDFDGWEAESARRTHRRADLLQAELYDLRHHRDELLEQQEKLTARILHLMMPGQSLPQVHGSEYDPATDPLVRQKREELIVLARYWDWQDQHNKRRTGRPMDATKTTDEQALEAALCARSMLVSDPPQRLRTKPQWVEFPWRLDEEGEVLAMQMSEEKIRDRQEKMGEFSL